MRKLGFIAFLWLFIQSSVWAQPAPFKTWGDETLQAVSRDYGISGSSLYRETMGSNAIAFNWPQGVQLHALIAARKLTEAGALADEMHAKYWCFTNNRWAYNASANSCGDRYYDDNAWIGKALMELYELTNDAKYLNRAKEVLAFSMSGENPPNGNPNGGIRWHEGDTSGQCLCGTAPTTVVNLQIYKATGETKYLTDGTRLYTWMRTNRFGLGPGYRGYENAVITQAALRLFQITGESKYWDDAKHMGLAMETVYIDWNTHALHETGQWGGHDMSAAYVELYNQDKDINWLNIASGFLKHLHDNSKDANGRYPEVWSVNGPASDGLLYQASAARGYAEMGNTKGGYPKHPDPVAVFKECNYAASYSAGLPLGRYTAADLDFIGMPNKAISSIKVQPGYKATLYTGDNFSGTSLVKTADSNCLVGEGFNDVVQSVVVEAVVPGAEVFRNCNYGDRSIHLPEGKYTMFDLQARGIDNDVISSIRISPKYEVEVFQDWNFNGTSKVLTASDSCLSDNGVDNWTSSIIVRPTKTGSKIDFTDLAGGSITAQYNDSPANEGVEKLIDNDTNTKYLAVHASAWVQFKAAEPHVLKSYTLTSANDFPERDPASWKLQGSSDGTTWTTLDKRKGQDFAGRFETRKFKIDNTKAYTHYRLTLTNHSGTLLQLAEIELWGK